MQFLALYLYFPGESIINSGKDCSIGKHFKPALKNALLANCSCRIYTYSLASGTGQIFSEKLERRPLFQSQSLQHKLKRCIYNVTYL